MATRLKEDERNERAIRALLKLPENRRCINCNSLGPQYVCTNFSTFVCTTCSGIHREFTHRVKSVSMAKFTSQEVSALQGGGNASAKEIYFKEWDPQRQSLPDGSNVDRLRDFIKHVYVDRRFTGEKGIDRPPRLKAGEAEDSNETRRMDTYQGGSRSPPYEETYDRRYGDRPSPGGRSDDRSSKNSYDERRSPGYDQDNRQYSDYRKSPARNEIVNDWRREDRFRNGRTSEDGQLSDGGSKLESQSPDRQRDLDMSSPPVVRPVRDILGESVSPLRVIEPPKANGPRSDGSIRTQRTASSSSLGSSNGNPTELKVESSLIDFDTVPEAPSTDPVPKAQTTALGPSFSTTPSSDNWANFDSFSEVKVSPAPSSVNLLESVLSELSVPTSSHGQAAVSGGVGASVTPGSSVNSFATAAMGGQWHSVHSQQFVPATNNQLPAQSFTQAVGGSMGNQTWNSASGQNTGAPSSGLAAQPPIFPGTVTTADVRPAGKKELPVDLFTSHHSAFPASGPGWYGPPQYGYGFNMPYNTAMHVPVFPQRSKSANPFDVHDEPSVANEPMFPSMAPLQRALPNVAAPTGIQRTTSLGTPHSNWMPPQSSQPAAMLPQGPPYQSTMPSGPYMGQVPLNLSPRQQGVGGFGFERPAFGNLNPSQQQSGFYSTPATQNNFSSVGGNPFG